MSQGSAMTDTAGKRHIEALTGLLHSGECDTLTCHESEAIQAAIAALAGQADAGGQEAVAWQMRFMLKDVGYWSGWSQCQSEESARLQVEQHTKHGYTAEWRALYTTPPAAIPVGALRELVEAASIVTQSPSFSLEEIMGMASLIRALERPEIAALIAATKEAG